MMTFEEVRNQLSSKICMGSQGDILTEKVMQLIEAAYDEGLRDQATSYMNQIKEIERQSEQPTGVVLDPSAELIELHVLTEMIDTAIASTGSKPAQKALRDLLAGVVTATYRNDDATE